MLNISVIIPVYNAAAFLVKAVESALMLPEVKEILLIEDNSTDSSLQVCEQLQANHDQIRFFQHPDKKNHGAAASRNLGLKKASQKFIAFLDADDYYLRNRFEAEKIYFKDEKVQGVFGALGTEFLTEKGKSEYLQKFKNADLTTVNFPAEGKQVFKGLLGLTERTFGTFFHLNTLTVRKKTLLKHGIFFNEKLRVHQDSEFILRLAFHCYLKSGIIDKAVAIRGIHDDNRITKIVQYSTEYNERQLIFWKSLYDWSKKEKIGDDAQKHIYLQKKAFELSTEKGVVKWSDFLLTLIKYPEILRTKYRFTYLQQ
ncbi:glycosyltransferase family 2 protein [Kaistella palustris]|uniref:glycosyltransferase family 2 protein n=1 Tax=Kaistella palustris TaxID=493376 RepID=UPI000418B3DD|nr:glycosyltransferase family 2 protein [Kaistella palustris]